MRSREGNPIVLDVGEPGGDWPVLEVASASICGSDLTLLGWNLPVTLGHEIAGTLDGRAYCVEPTVRCGRCDQCLLGAPQRCRGEAPHGIIGVAFDGGLAERVAVPPDCLVALPESLDVRDASLVEPLAVSWHALRKVAAAPGERVLVVGGGSVGLLAVAAAAAMGLEVDLEARHDHQRAAGECLGAGAPHGQYDITVEAAGTDTALATCVRKAAPGGRIALVGVAADDRRVPSIPFVMNELSMVGCNCYDNGAGGHEFAQSAAVLADNPQIAQTVITHRFALHDAAEAFRVAADRAGGAIKVVLEP
ncbi:MAG: alcohol dehydrogenase catalytic domain-containing protein [Mycobacterium sp.]|nr:alcohol dehydrogenase catalytic domain-containing protein [Mycobacterium sp.]